jgi:hypothetical protein
MRSIVGPAPSDAVLACAIVVIAVISTGPPEPLAPLRGLLRERDPGKVDKPCVVFRSEWTERVINASTNVPTRSDLQDQYGV